MLAAAGAGPCTRARIFANALSRVVDVSSEKGARPRRRGTGVPTDSRLACHECVLILFSCPASPSGFARSGNLRSRGMGARLQEACRERSGVPSRLAGTARSSPHSTMLVCRPFNGGLTEPPARAVRAAASAVRSMGGRRRPDPLQPGPAPATVALASGNRRSAVAHGFHLVPASAACARAMPRDRASLCDRGNPSCLAKAVCRDTWWRSSP
jgi:hypothetical protein